MGASTPTPPPTHHPSHLSLVRRTVAVHCTNSRSRTPLVLSVFFGVLRRVGMARATSWVARAIRTQRSQAAARAGERSLSLSLSLSLVLLTHSHSLPPLFHSR